MMLEQNLLKLTMQLHLEFLESLTTTAKNGPWSILWRDFMYNR